MTETIQTEAAVKPEFKVKQPQPVFMSIVRGEKNLSERKVQLIPSREGDDPFVAIDVKTGRNVSLQQEERLIAYGLLNTPAPEGLVQSFETSKRIRKRKERKILQKRHSS